MADGGTVDSVDGGPVDVVGGVVAAVVAVVVMGEDAVPVGVSVVHAAVSDIATQAAAAARPRDHAGARDDDPAPRSRHVPMQPRGRYLRAS